MSSKLHTLEWRKTIVHHGDIIQYHKIIKPKMLFPRFSISDQLVYGVSFSSQLFKLINVADYTTLITQLDNEGVMNEPIHFELAKCHDWFKANKRSLNIINMPTKAMGLLRCLKKDTASIA